MKDDKQNDSLFPEIAVPGSLLSFSGSCVDYGQLAGLSSFHFARMFRRETGETPHGFVVRLRLEESARLLRTARQTVLQIAIAVGFGSTSHFSARFRRGYGVTPRADRLTGLQNERPATAAFGWQNDRPPLVRLLERITRVSQFAAHCAPCKLRTFVASRG